MKYFTLYELGAESEGQFHPGFISKLETLRIGVERPFIVTSCARSQDYNKTIGGHPRSLHIWDKPQHERQKGCMAIDIHVLDMDFKVEVVKMALLLGWSVGINDDKRFLHLDRRTDIFKPQTLFTY
jgi:uncharacterized protein YcbK (DUF882 family)